MELVQLAFDYGVPLSSAVGITQQAQLHTIVYYMCTQRSGDLCAGLHTWFCGALERYLHVYAASAITQPPNFRGSPPPLRTAAPRAMVVACPVTAWSIVAQWVFYKQLRGLLCRFVRYLSRYHVPRHSLPALEDTAGKTFHLWVQHHSGWVALLQAETRSHLTAKGTAVGDLASLGVDGVNALEAAELDVSTGAIARMLEILGEEMNRTCGKCRTKGTKLKHDWPGRPRSGERMYWACCSDEWHALGGGEDSA